MTLIDLITFLDSQKISLEAEQAEQLNIYLKLLKKWNLKINLFSRGDQKFLVERHFLTSFYFVYILKKYIQTGSVIVDMGSGAGFPGIIINIAFPGAKVVLIDSSRKKALFLNKVINELNLSAEVINERLEFVAREEKIKADILTARALAGMPDLIPYGKHFLKPGGMLLTIKGVNYYQELKLQTGTKDSLSEIEIEKTWLMQDAYLEKKLFIKWEPLTLTV